MSTSVQLKLQQPVTNHDHTRSRSNYEQRAAPNFHSDYNCCANLDHGKLGMHHTWSQQHVLHILVTNLVSRRRQEQQHDVVVVDGGRSTGTTLCVEVDGGDGGWHQGGQENDGVDRYCLQRYRLCEQDEKNGSSQSRNKGRGSGTLGERKPYSDARFQSPEPDRFQDTKQTGHMQFPGRLQASDMGFRAATKQALKAGAAFDSGCL